MIAHVSEAGTALAAALARHAEAAGAAAIVATTPYYWTPPPAMVLEHFALIGAAVKIPLFVHNAPDDMSGQQGHGGPDGQADRPAATISPG